MMSLGFIATAVQNVPLENHTVSSAPLGGTDTWITELIGNNTDFVAGLGQRQHRPHKVFAVRPINPSGAKNHLIRRAPAIVRSPAREAVCLPTHLIIKGIHFSGIGKAIVVRANPESWSDDWSLRLPQTNSRPFP
jgi:hypothetical protein